MEALGNELSFHHTAAYDVGVGGEHTSLRVVGDGQVSGITESPNKLGRFGSSNVMIQGAVLSSTHNNKDS